MQIPRHSRLLGSFPEERGKFRALPWKSPRSRVIIRAD